MKIDESKYEFKILTELAMKLTKAYKAYHW